MAVCTFAFSSGPGVEPILFQGRTEVCMYYSASQDPPTSEMVGLKV